MEQSLTTFSPVMMNEFTHSPPAFFPCNTLASSVMPVKEVSGETKPTEQLASVKAVPF